MKLSTVRKNNKPYNAMRSRLAAMEKQLLLSDRLASIGQLAYGIVHELNNPLAGVIGYSDVLLRRKDLPEEIMEDLKIVSSEAWRASQIVKGLLTFARKDTARKEPVDIHGAIQAVLRLRRYEQEATHIKVKTDFLPDLPFVMGNPTQMQQVFINIILNAEQAMSEAHGKGMLVITTRRVQDYVRISFMDDGPGINQENMPRLFTPFFTTKVAGKGTGLGLSICQGIITEHGGKIYARNERGKGAAFIIELPVAMVLE
jgi:signal transduction histidine kinase